MCFTFGNNRSWCSVSVYYEKWTPVIHDEFSTPTVCPNHNTWPLFISLSGALLITSWLIEHGSITEHLPVSLYTAVTTYIAGPVVLLTLYFKFQVMLLWTYCLFWTKAADDVYKTGRQSSLSVQSGTSSDGRETPLIRSHSRLSSASSARYLSVQSL